MIAGRKLIANSFFGGGVWESNPPGPALTNPRTVLKTAPLTRTGAPPRRPRPETYAPRARAVKQGSAAAPAARSERRGRPPPAPSTRPGRRRPHRTRCADGPHRAIPRNPHAEEL